MTVKQKILRMTRAVRRWWSRFWQRNWRLLLSVFSAGLAATLMLLLFSPTVVIIIMAVIVVHELGHYFAAVLSDCPADPPFFIPLIFGVMGATRIACQTARDRARISMAGPIAGAITAAILALVFIALGIEVLVYVCLGALAFEIYSATLGSDGKRFRKARRHQRHATMAGA